MKKLITIISLAAMTSVISCQEEISNEVNNKKMEDTLFSSFPTVNRVSVEVKDHEEVIVTLGDAELYNDSDEKRKQVASEIGNITMHIYKEGNWLRKGSVVFVKEENTIQVDDATKKVYNMGIEDIKQVQ